MPDQPNPPSSRKLAKTSTPGIYRRGDRYVVIWRHRGRQHKSFHATLAEAREAKGQRSSRSQHDRQPGTKATMEDYAREWLRTYRGRPGKSCSQRSRAAYLAALDRHVFPQLGGVRLGELGPRDLRGLVADLLDGGLAPASVIKVFVPIKAMFADAVDDGDLAMNPAARIHVPRTRGDEAEEPGAKAMTTTELARVLSEVPERHALLFELLAQTGLRISELLGLDWSDVVFGVKPRLQVRRQFYRGEMKRLKTVNGRRTLPLSPELARHLWAARPADGVGPMFATRTGTRLGERNLRGC